jgi:predicted transcriptional regulator with HTH domain
MHVNSLPEVKDIVSLDEQDRTDGCYSYNLTLSENDTERQQAIATVAQTVIQKGFQLYRITEVTKDLESVFKDVTNSVYEEVANAA